MAVAKVIEVNASSTNSVEDAVRHGLKKTAETVKGIKGAWVNEVKVVTNDAGDITEWRVNLRITFVVQ
jgi:flavin-binding protein dodecin